jgi:hypothetical protein
MTTEPAKRDPADILAPHERQPLHKFLAASGPDDFGALCALVYADLPADYRLTLSRAETVARELAASEKTVGDVVRGWRPPAIRFLEISVADGAS